MVTIIATSALLISSLSVRFCTLQKSQAKADQEPIAPKQSAATIARPTRKFNMMSPIRSRGRNPNLLNHRDTEGTEKNRSPSPSSLCDLCASLVKSRGAAKRHPTLRRGRQYLADVSPVGCQGGEEAGQGR